jgi:hypothetical protein
MELNEEVVKKSLDWLDSLVGNSNDSDIALLTYQLLGILYDTCEELTEENERLRGIGTPDHKTYIRLSDAKNAIMDYIGEQTVSKYASEAECKSARGGAEGAMNELDYITPVKVAPIADTVRQMQERTKAKILEINGNLCGLLPFIDQIAKEMLEDKE